MLDPGKVTYTFALGSYSLYATANRNPNWYCPQVDCTNSPYIIMQNEKVVSINNTTQVDLQGQVASESDRHRHISGTEGQLQFVLGCLRIKGR
jgi:acyl-CoA hydrolase